jgi:Ca2+:H+ antiporter
MRSRVSPVCRAGSCGFNYSSRPIARITGCHEFHKRVTLRREWFLGVSIATALAFLLFGDNLQNELTGAASSFAAFTWLFIVILMSALRVVKHAEYLALRLGEPYGTLILTLSVTAIEATSISAVMLHGGNNPTLVRDTLFAVIMIILNGMVGASLLLGAWRHREQHYNLQGANTYLSVIIPLAVLSLVMPNFTQTTPGPTLSFPQEIFLALMSLGLYVAFLVIQTGRHRGYFMAAEEQSEAAPLAVPKNNSRLLRHALLLAGYMIPVVFLAEKLGPPIDYLIETAHAPAALGGMLIASLVAAPEAIGAIRSAMANQLQRSMNIFLGSVLSTIGLTIPIMLVVSHISGREIYLGVQNTSLVMLVLTLFLSAVTFASGRTNVLQGAVHVLLFVAYVLLIFQN